MRKYINVAVLLFVLGMCAAPSWAQLEGIIRGTVKGADGKPLAGATIQMYDSQTGRRFSGTTNSKGEYSMNAVYAGTYKMTLLVKGNPVDERNNVGLGAGQEQVVDWDEGGRAPSSAMSSVRRLLTLRKRTRRSRV